MKCNADDNFVVAVMSKTERNLGKVSADDCRRGVCSMRFLDIFDVFDGDSDVEVVIDDFNIVFDIQIDGESLGYYPVKAICSATGFILRELKYQGEFSQDQLGEMANGESIYILPLFGAVVE